MRRNDKCDLCALFRNLGHEISINEQNSSHSEEIKQFVCNINMENGWCYTKKKYLLVWVWQIFLDLLNEIFTQLRMIKGSWKQYWIVFKGFLNSCKHHVLKLDISEREWVRTSRKFRNSVFISGSHPLCRGSHAHAFCLSADITQEADYYILHLICWYHILPTSYLSLSDDILHLSNQMFEYCTIISKG